jgi:predicted component of type VI protein secretion system
MNKFRSLIVLAVCCLAFSASAQWQWLDKDGRRVFSDRPPPADVPEKNILKRPGSRGSFAPSPAAAPAPAGAAAAPQTGVDKSLEEKRKQAEAAEAAKRKEEEERSARIRAENCSRAQQAKVGVDSGVRMARINEKGEREFMDEAGIAAESQRLQTIINENCR